MRESCEIEHLKPRKWFSELSLDYLNFLVSCHGGAVVEGENESRRSGRGNRHCGQRKGNWFDENLLISPLDPGCEEYFSFYPDGRVKPSDNRNPAAEETITRLGLNCARLKNFRKEAIEPVIEAFDHLTSDELQRWYESLYERDNEGRFSPFCFAIRSVLGKNLG